MKYLLLLSMLSLVGCASSLKHKDEEASIVIDPIKIENDKRCQDKLDNALLELEVYKNKDKYKTPRRRY